MQNYIKYIAKIISLVPFHFFNVATRTFPMMHVAHITFLLDPAAPEPLLASNPYSTMQSCENSVGFRFSCNMV